MNFIMKGILEILKKYSDIDIPFIRKFLKIQKGDKTHDPFKIRLKYMADLLELKKEDTKKILFRLYTEKIDYLVISSEIILLTPGCFNSFCMSSNAKLAEKIRDYYASLDSLIEIYEDARVEKLKERDQKNSTEGAVYVLVKNNKYELWKTKNINRRIQSYNNTHKSQIEYVFYSSDINQLKVCIELALEKEVIDLIDIVKVVKKCNKLISHFKCMLCKKMGRSVDFSRHIKKYHKTNLINQKF